jgi:DNA-directed RNA polymerase specialized sigma24 family protein
MADPRKLPPKPAPDASERDADAPVSSARPAVGDNAAPERASPAPLPSTGTPKPPTGAAAPGVTREELWAFVALESTQDRIRQVVHANVPRGTPRDVFEEIVQKANMRALETKFRARTSATLRPWISKIAERAALDHFRRNDVQLRREDRSIDVEQVPPEPADAPAGADEFDTAPWMVSQWLEKRVANHPGDKRTFDLIVQKARENKTYEQLAAERGETVTALKNRVHELKKKYLPLRRRHEERRDAYLFLLRFGRQLLYVAAAAALILFALLYSLRLGPFAPAPRPATSSTPVKVEPASGDNVAHPPPE